MSPLHRKLSHDPSSAKRKQVVPDPSPKHKKSLAHQPSIKPFAGIKHSDSTIIKKSPSKGTYKKVKSSSKLGIVPTVSIVKKQHTSPEEIALNVADINFTNDNHLSLTDLVDNHPESLVNL